jgi:hypothetical protein
MRTARQHVSAQQRPGTHPAKALLLVGGLEQFLAGGVVCRPVLQERIESLAISTAVQVGELVEEAGCSPHRSSIPCLLPVTDEGGDGRDGHDRRPQRWLGSRLRSRGGSRLRSRSHG